MESSEDTEDLENCWTFYNDGSYLYLGYGSYTLERLISENLLPDSWLDDLLSYLEHYLKLILEGSILCDIKLHENKVVYDNFFLRTFLAENI